ncbi:uncharacterized protein NDAI_0H03250 [Naumovozyma dairenensis CBS 421]|uniref:Aldehyde dehydrogenase domain-containing protein n=1 Tax=Naumovozyma dairenensis (strain ATCC 10597 / BCRC 20456 / CBS 421 / NBRC 0211 / NRRL Y-12639) TaxID=1071378 RepID=G0WFD7_NAUDC|nr:hypothetical protein NDAI_0H03250 [Naumovozyma dairenensis CBS 421]CCD26498.1 hypothetical protein NDAI_0H03250 [Naumovozyma dairenensis CBS 421]
MFTQIHIPQRNLTLKQPIGLFINNEFVKSENEEKIETINPSTGEVITSFYSGSFADVDRAVKAASDAYENVWKHTSPAERSLLLMKLADLIERDKCTLAALETLDSGKPYHSNAMLDLEQIIYLTRYFAGATDKFTTGETIPISEEKFCYTLMAPYGVVGQIVPWNYPLAMASWKIQGCLATGNTIVLKPAENTSLSVLYLAQLFVEAGFPPGVLNIIPGNGAVVGNALGKHPGIEKISFTGSTSVGLGILKASAESNMKDVTLECGGKSPAVIFEDANLEQAIEWTAKGIFFNSGQNCTANSRIYVHYSNYDKFLELFTKHIKEKWGFGKNFDPFDEDCTIGPVISKKQFDKISEFLKGEMPHPETPYKLSYTCKVHKVLDDPPESNKGFFIPPTIFTSVPYDSPWNTEEIFGPAVTVTPFETYDEVIKLANNTSYGLASAIFTENIRTANKFINDIQAGTVWVNSSNDPEMSVPFGGYKMSGIGRELGKSGVETYCQTKAVHMSLAQPGS